MPPLDVDKQAVKAHALTYGLTAAATAFGISVGTVKAWSGRDPDGPWFAKAGQATVAQPLPKSMQPMQPKAKIGPVEAVRNSQAAMGEKTKAKAGKALLAGLSHAAKQKGEAALVQLPLVKAGIDAGAKLYGWGAETQQALVGLSITVQSELAQVVDVAATVERVATE